MALLTHIRAIAATTLLYFPISVKTTDCVLEEALYRVVDFLAPDQEDISSNPERERTWQNT
jgi:hypothetical protein